MLQATRHADGLPVVEVAMSAPSVLMNDEPARHNPAAEAGALPHPQLVRTRDPYEARVRTQRFLNCSHGRGVLDRDEPFFARVDYRSLGGLGLMTSTYGPAVAIGCAPPIPWVTVNFVAGGAMLIEDGGTAAVADANNAAAFCFHEDLETRIDLRGSAGQGIAAAVQTMRRALTLCGKAGPPPVLAAEIEHGILTSLLLGHRHNYTDAIFSAQALPSPRVVRRVVELIDSAPQTAFT